MEIILNQDNFDAVLAKTTTPILIDFWAEWCGPCKAIAPVLNEIAKEYEGRLAIGKLNVDEFPALAEKYHVQSIPNMKIFKNGQIVDELVGLMPKAEIVKRAEKHIQG